MISPYFMYLQPDKLEAKLVQAYLMGKYHEQQLQGTRLRDIEFYQNLASGSYLSSFSKMDIETAKIQVQKIIDPKLRRPVDK